MRRRGRRNVSIVSGVEEPSEIGKRTASCGDVEHCTDEESDHVMQEPVGFDREHQPARSFTPARVRHAASVIVMGGRRPDNGEAPEAMVTLELSGRRIQSAPVQGLPECELIPTTKR